MVSSFPAQPIMKKLVLITVFALGLGSAQSQGLFRRRFEPKQVILFDLTLKRQYPGADMLSRFGPNTSIGMELSYKTTGNWVFHVGGHFLFGKQVNETGILDSLKGSTGEIIDQNGQFAVVGMDERGMYWGAGLGKVIPLNKINRNSGIYLSVGGGYLQHRIRIYSSNTVPQLNSDYKRGYDRLTFGPAASQYIGYRFLDPRKRLNFSIGIEIIEGFTKNRRSLDFDTGQRDTRQRLDLLTGIRFSLTVPLYLKKASEEEFFE